MTRAAVVVFPGSNCDRDCERALKLVGFETEFVWHRDDDLSGFDLVVLPGGFSYGDYLRAGAIAKVSPVMAGVKKHASTGGLVLGICNGFQILLEVGLLPGAMTRNMSLNFICRDVFLNVENNETSFTSGYKPGVAIRIPIAHGEGNYRIDEAGYALLRDNGQIAFRYCDQHGEESVASNPNGSLGSIAGVFSVEKNVLGMMPHPERVAEAVLGGEDGRILFESVLNHMESR